MSNSTLIPINGVLAQIIFDIKVYAISVYNIILINCYQKGHTKACILIEDDWFQFACFLKDNQIAFHTFLRRVNLGLSGVNILWIFED